MSIMTWAQYKEKVCNEINKPELKSRFIFRGQSDEGWSLETSLYRAVKDVGKEVKLTEHYANSLRIVCQRVSSVEDKIWNIENNVMPFLSYIQHHGFPTPLQFHPY